MSIHSIHIHDGSCKVDKNKRIQKEILLSINKMNKWALYYDKNLWYIIIIKLKQVSLTSWTCVPP